MTDDRRQIADWLLSILIAENAPKAVLKESRPIAEIVDSRSYVISAICHLSSRRRRAGRVPLLPGRFSHSTPVPEVLFPLSRSKPLLSHRLEFQPRYRIHCLRSENKRLDPGPSRELPRLTFRVQVFSDQWLRRDGLHRNRWHQRCQVRPAARKRLELSKMSPLRNSRGRSHSGW